MQALRAIGVEIRAGVHFGETESSEGRVSGIVVHTAARVMALADPSEILITRTVQPSGQRSPDACEREADRPDGRSWRRLDPS